MNTLRVRLERLEAARRAGKCQTCFNHPTRIIGITEDGELINETFPETGCPACERPIASTLQIVGIDPLEV